MNPTERSFGVHDILRKIYFIAHGRSGWKNWRDDKGSAAVEFAIVSLLAFTFYVGVAEGYVMLDTHRKLERITANVAREISIVSAKTVSQSDYVNQLLAASVFSFNVFGPRKVHGGIPFPANSPSLHMYWIRGCKDAPTDQTCPSILECIELTKKLEIKHCTEKESEHAIPPDLKASANYFIQIDAQFDYTPILNWPFSPIVMSATKLIPLRYDRPA